MTQINKSKLKNNNNKIENWNKHVNLQNTLHLIARDILKISKGGIFQKAEAKIWCTVFT